MSRLRFHKGALLVADATRMVLAGDGAAVNTVSLNVEGTISPATETSAAQTIEAVRVWMADVTEQSLALSEAQAVFPRYRLTDTLAVEPLADPTLYYRKALMQGFSVGDASRVGWPKTATESGVFSDATVPTIGAYVSDALGLTEVYATDATYRLTVDEALQVADTLLRYMGGELLETLALSEQTAPQLSASKTASEAVAFADAATNTLVARVVSTETLDVSDAELLRMVFRGELTEEVEFSVGTVMPSGFTAWAFNTRTGGATEYRNFRFNSFVEMGPHYLGASADGLYELAGDTDDGEPVIGKLRSAFLQFNGGRHATLDAAYIGARGDGDFVFRLVTADGRMYDYHTRTDSMRTARVKLGRGLRARYIAFELESTGQDFDLESIELLPVAMYRRV